MTPGPDEVDVHHGIAAGLVREEMKSQVAIEEKHREGRGQDRESRDDQKIGSERGPAEYGHLHVAHAGRAQLQNGRGEVYA
jgi:hypothetical protein